MPARMANSKVCTSGLELLTCGRTKEFLFLLTICSAVRVYGMCIVHIADCVMPGVTRLILLQKYEVSATEVRRKSVTGCIS